MASGGDEDGDPDFEGIFPEDMDPTKSLITFPSQREKLKSKKLMTFQDSSDGEERRKDSSLEEQWRSRSESLDLEGTDIVMYSYCSRADFKHGYFLVSNMQLKFGF